MLHSASPPPPPQRLLSPAPLPIYFYPVPSSVHHCHPQNPMRVSSLFPLFLLLFFFSSPNFFASSDTSNTDIHPLMEFKSSSDTWGALSSWDPAVDPCSGRWLGVSCARGRGRVTRVVLEGLGLTGPIDSLAALPRLSFLSLANNSLSHPLRLLDPSSWRPHLKILRLSSNSFSGPFPSSFLLLRRLRRLDLANNLISGTIPSEIGAQLPRLLTLRLQFNLLGGEIPVSIGSIPALSDLNLSHNRLIGDVPPSLSSFPPTSFTGNRALCGQPLPMTCTKLTAPSNPAPSNPAPPIPAPRKRKWTTMIAVVAAAITAALSVTAMIFFLCRGRGERRDRRDEEREVGTRGGEGREEGMMVFEGCKAFELEELMRGSAEMLGRGPAGTTYRVMMEEREGEGVVVKRVRRERGGKRQEEAEERLLREVGGLRHPNVVSLRAYYSSQEELLLVYDYLPGGSLHSLLHGYRGPGRNTVDWNTRLRLASGAANGLAFLHNTSKSKLSHQHLTSSNILVDGEGNARVSDFALLLLQSPSSPSSSFRMVSPIVLNTSSMREIFQKNDVYSFGIILLEILTGRTTGDGNMDLTKWVQMVVREEWTSEVFDFELLRYKEMEDEMVALLQVALLCLAREPKDRPKMSMVHKMIEDIRERGYRRGTGSQSPSVNDHVYETSSTCLSEDTPTFTSS